ncbi:MAG: DNA methyltransferase, partial [Bacilli bacterium]|nr:DNA methyltransferase [Bacilli bacterium]
RRAFIRNDFKKLSQDNPNKIFTNYSENKTHYYYRGREMFFVDDKIHTCLTEDGYKTTLSNLLADMWLDINTGRLFNEGGVEFRNSKKPEFLIARILEIASSKNDIILDSFLGSGTTASVAHKMGRKWIGIEMGDHAYSLCKVRLDNVINNSDPGGVSKIFNWSGGGGYKFYELAPTLIKIDSFGQAIINPEYNADMLAAAVALHEGYNYEPDQTLFWKQAKNGESSYLFTTTRHLDRTFIDSVASQMTENEFLVISCKSFDALVLNLHKNIAIKKIPQSLLKNCEFDKDNYNLNIINPPVYEGDEEDE